MSDDGIKKLFSLAAKNPFKLGEGKQDKIRDRDNAMHQISPPSMAKYTAKNLAPRGMSGIKRSLPDNSAHGLVIEKAEPITDISVSGHLENRPDVTFEAEIAADQNRDGLNGGPINKLAIFDQDRAVANYDRGWKIAPETTADHEMLDTAASRLTDFAQELQQQQRETSPDLTIEEGRFQDGELTDGVIPDRENMNFTAKVETENHPDGLNGGPVTFLDLRENGLTVARYDHGWVMQPGKDEDRDAVKSANDALEGFNREFKPIVPPETDKDKGHDIDR